MQINTRYWMALNAMQSLSYGKLKILLKQFGDIKQIFSASEYGLRSSGLTQKQAQKIKSFDFNQLKNDMYWLEEENNHIILLSDDRYPNLLKEIKDPPLLLYAKGNVALLQKPQLAIVGSRKPTPLGERTAHDFAYELAATGLTITSGLALGVDGASHQGALNAEGSTIAVLGTGLDAIYPRRHQKLAEQIAQQSLLISEFSHGTPPMRENFPRRNRVISGLSLGVLVIEAAIKSGSLITARLAGEQGREVFAIPSSIRNIQAKGCHHLIKEGATLIESSDDICTELTSLLSYQASFIAKNSDKTPKKAHLSKETLDFRALDKDDIALLKLITEEPISVDQLIIQSHLSTQLVADSLLKLEMDNFIKVTTGGYCRL